MSADLTQRQQKWFASVEANLERDTGRSLADWVAIAKTCPATGHRARLAWFKETHGLMQNRASLVLSTTFPSVVAWSEPDGLRDALWQDPAARTILERVAALAEALPEVVIGQRKAFSAWSRQFQFAALRPVKDGSALLGLAVPPDCDPRLVASRNDGWSERLRARLELAGPDAVDESVAALLQRAWAAS